MTNAERRELVRTLRTLQESAHGPVFSMAADELERLSNRLKAYEPKTLSERVEDAYKMQDQLKRIFKNMPGGTP